MEPWGGSCSTPPWGGDTMLWSLSWGTWQGWGGVGVFAKGYLLVFLLVGTCVVPTSSEMSQDTEEGK